MVLDYNYPLPQFHTNEDYFHALEEMAELRFRVRELEAQIKPQKKKPALDFLPTPIIKDKLGLHVAHYSLEKWFETIARYVLKAHAECREEVTIVQNGLYPQWQKKNISGLAARTTELITVCTSLLNSLGYDEKARLELQREVNDKNREAGLTK